MKYINLTRKNIYLLFLLIFLAACGSGFEEEKNNDIPVRQSTDAIPSAISQPVISPTSENEPKIENENDIMKVFSDLSPENIEYIQEDEKYFPFFPPYTAISGNQKVIAFGDQSGVKIISIETDDILMEIDVNMPICQYGLDNYLHFDYTGNFLAISTLTGIEIYQVGGGVIYSRPYQLEYPLNMLTCGLDIPQLAISPGGEYLAESGVEKSPKGYSEYFRLIDVFKNEVVYQWNGNDAEMHGTFDTHQGLGFSSDGLVLQTFIPKYFELGIENFHSAFKFWSVSTKQELDANSLMVQNSFGLGDRLFSISESNSVKIYEKGNKEIITQIKKEGCVWDDPCDTIISEDGSKFAFLINTNKVFYKRDMLQYWIQIYDVESGAYIKETEVLIINWKSILLKNNGELIIPEIILEDTPSWWTYTSYFSGLKENKNSIVFTPQIHDILDNGPMYSGTCSVDEDSRKLICDKGILLEEDTVIQVEYLDSGFTLLDNGNVIVQIKYPAGSPDDLWQVRLKAYDENNHTGYFCLDRNYREETCVIMNFSENTILEEQIDLYGFKRSQKKSTAVFIHREEKRLILFDENTSRMKTIVPFEAVAYAVKPALVADGNELIYFVESLKTGDLYLDHLSLEGGKVIKRYGFDGMGEIRPTSIAVSPGNEIWSISDENGIIYFLDPETEETIHQIAISQFGIADLIFTKDGKQLYVMDNSGVLTRWVVEKK